MDKNDLKKATELALSGEHIGILSTEKFDGFALRNFSSVYCTITEVAQLIRWQCLQMNGQIDGEAYDILCKAGRTKFIVTG